MRPRERFGALVALAVLSVGAGIAQADPVDLKPFKATYSAEWKGMNAATSVLELKAAGADTYTYTSTNSARGLFRMAFPDSLSQTSTFRVSDGKVVPISFRGTDEKDREITLDFDWTKNRVTGKAKDHDVDLALPAGAQDAMSMQIASLRNLAAGKLEPIGWMVDSDKLKEFELRQEGSARITTALGDLDTVIYTSRRPNSDRVTRTWVAPALGYLPVKAERLRGTKVEFTLKLDAVDR